MLRDDPVVVIATSETTGATRAYGSVGRQMQVTGTGWPVASALIENAGMRSMPREALGLDRSAPGVGLEPTTYGLTVRRSAN